MMWVSTGYNLCHKRFAQQPNKQIVQKLIQVVTLQLLSRTSKLTNKRIGSFFILSFFQLSIWAMNNLVYNRNEMIEITMTK